MKVVDMSRKDNMFWSLNISLSLLLCMAVYAVGHSAALAGALYGTESAAFVQKGLLKLVHFKTTVFSFSISFSRNQNTFIYFIN